MANGSIHICDSDLMSTLNFSGFAYLRMDHCRPVSFVIDFPISEYNLQQPLGSVDLQLCTIFRVRVFESSNFSHQSSTQLFYVFAVGYVFSVVWNS